MSAWFAMGLAPALQPWGLIGPGAATVVRAKLSSWESYLALFLFCVVASSSYLAMEIRTDQVIIVGSLILGFWLIGNSIYLIVSRDRCRPP